MPAKGSGVDDRKNMNAFLVMIGRTPVADDPPEKTITMVPCPRSYPIAPSSIATTPTKSQSSEDNIAGPDSPSAGTRAPHTTPATTTTALEKSIDLVLDPIQEHELPEIFAKLSDPKSTLHDSKHAQSLRRLYTKIPSRYTTATKSPRNPNTGPFVNKLDYPEPEFSRTTVQQEILDKITFRNAKLARSSPAPVTPITPVTPPTPSTDDIDETSSDMNSRFEEDVIAKFKARAAAKEMGNENVKITPALPSIEERKSEFTTNTAKTPDPREWLFPEGTALYGLSEAQLSAKENIEVKASIAQDIEAVAPVKASIAQNTETVAPAKASITQNTETVTPVKASIAEDTETVTPVKASTSQDNKTITPVKASIAQNTKGVAPVKSAQAILNGAKAELIAKTAGLTLSVKEPGSPEERSAIVVASSEDPANRETATHFTSWGTPQARAIPPAKVRKVVLRGLPASADLTLVQSIIHGGAIDNFALGVNGTAQVTFTTPEACDAYYTKYPNGLTVKYKGKNAVVFVEKATDVNVVSGMLQGQLACGASRCVRAVGADHDWGMAALIKLAEGKTRKGKVEHIADAWRSEVRTIVFRFTSISAAVSFKGMLVRHEDWEGCNVQFMDDPCEKATGVHLE